MIPNGRLSLDRFLHLLVVAAIVWGAVWLLGRLSAVLIPFILALTLDYVLDPLVDRIQLWVKSRVAAVLITVLGLVGITTAFLVIVVPMIVHEATHFADLVRDQLPALQRNVQGQPLLHDLALQLASIDWHSYLTTDNLTVMARKVLPGFWGGVSNVLGWMLGLIGVFTTLLYMVFLLVDEEQLKGKWQTLIPDAYRPRTVALIHDLQRVLDRHFRGQLKIAAILSVVYIAGFWVIGLPLAMLLGLLAGLLNLIPYFGLVSLLPVTFAAVIVSMESGRSFGMVMLLVLVVYAVAQALEGLVLTPRIQGKNTGLRPVVILLSLSVWGSLLGFVGLLLALPLTTLLLSYYRRFVLGVEESPAIPPAPSPPPGPSK